LPFLPSAEKAKKMQRHRTREVKKRGFASIWLAVPFLAGLLLGWLALGWGAWPVSYRNALPASLRAADREAYIVLAAESYGANGDASKGRARLETWPRDLLAADIARLQTRLWTEDARRADQVHALADAVGVEQPAAPTARPSDPVDLTSTENILVLGTDNRPELEAWRTDTIMVLAVDRKTNQVGIVSVPRDLYVDIPGHAKDRINATAYIGEKTDYPGSGAALTQRVIEENLGIPTQHWVLIRQEGLVNLIDALGGVTITLDCPLYEATPDQTSASGLKMFTLPAGQVHLDGATAKKFATYRYVESDFGRVKRQQQLIWAIRNRALQANILPRIPELWQALSDTFKTDLGLPDVVKLAALGARLKAQDVHGLTLDGDVVEAYTTPEGWEVLVLKSKAAVQEKLSQLFFAKPLSETGKRSSESEKCPPPPFEVPAQ
jgi:LCP family protein required for cell wall assembly